MNLQSKDTTGKISENVAQNAVNQTGKIIIN